MKDNKSIELWVWSPLRCGTFTLVEKADSITTNLTWVYSDNLDLNGCLD